MFSTSSPILRREPDAVLVPSDDLTSCGDFALGVVGYQAGSLVTAGVRAIGFLCPQTLSRWMTRKRWPIVVFFALHQERPYLIGEQPSLRGDLRVGKIVNRQPHLVIKQTD